ncbi:uncharacterized protein KY384_008123 [Bacidia gigantensis]|uniref:uncharacterized protein n=1 Tax=Bacidia gigantensis TaxID=2732470 RepID=UPI001D05AF78|nr:uncharacterized protein KY384_008123 [Bacidia gigantensis]KAG8526694.1 hypothetical protein KY384_008123 [Bacidia gigantensis]
MELNQSNPRGQLHPDHQNQREDLSHKGTKPVMTSDHCSPSGSPRASITNQSVTSSSPEDAQATNEATDPVLTSKPIPLSSDHLVQKTHKTSSSPEENEVSKPSKQNAQSAATSPTRSSETKLALLKTRLSGVDTSIVITEEEKARLTPEHKTELGRWFIARIVRDVEVREFANSNGPPSVSPSRDRRRLRAIEMERQQRSLEARPTRYRRPCEPEEDEEESVIGDSADGGAGRKKIRQM